MRQFRQNYPMQKIPNIGTLAAIKVLTKNFILTFGSKIKRPNKGMRKTDQSIIILGQQMV